MENDLVIVGGGFAGLSVGVRAVELGLRAAIIERGARDEYLCNSRYSGGHVSICMDDPAKEPAYIAERIIEQTCNTFDSEFIKQYAAKARPALEWLRGHRVKFIRIGDDPGRQWVMAPPRRGQPGLEWKGRGPDMALNGLARRFCELGGMLHCGSVAKDIVLRDGKLAGVLISQEGREIEVRGKNVVLADGGFQSSQEFLKEFVSKNPEKLFQRNARTAEGWALGVARRLGAELVGMDKFYGHPLSRDAFHNDKLWPHPYLDILTVSGIVVGLDGRRFVDEGLGAVNLANELARRSDPLDSYVIFDDLTWNGPAANVALAPAPNPSLMVAGATTYQASSLDALAEKSGIDRANLESSVAAHNRAVAANDPNVCEPSRTLSRYKAAPIVKAPFYAIPMCCGITYTMGGPKVNIHGQVLHENANPIPNLYAVGSASGGLEGGPKSGYVGGIAKAVILGTSAAEHIASTAK